MDGKAYRKLDVWNDAMELVIACYKLVEQLPDTEKFGLMSQIRRCSVSIPANIAEGYGREHRGDYVRFLSMARGSLMELETHLTLCVRLKLTVREAVLPVWELCQKVGRQLTALIRSLKIQTQDPSPKTPASNTQMTD